MAKHELGVFFTLKDVERRKYEAEAWKVFMKHTDPSLLRKAQLFDGEMRGPSPDGQRMFCIAIRSQDFDAIRYVKEAFTSSDDEMLAALHDRTWESDVINMYQLKYRGQIDAQGRLETENWSRVDHELCKATGWPYTPLTQPAHLSPELVLDLEKMSVPGFKPTEQPEPRPESFQERKGPTLPWDISSPRIVKGALVVALGVLLLFGLLKWRAVANYLKHGKENIGRQLAMGPAATKRYEKGFSMAGISKIPLGLELPALNEKLADRAYYIFPHRNDSLFDVWVDCTVWFASNVERDPLPRTKIQAFIKINLKALDGSPLWTHQSKGVRISQGTEAANPGLRQEALGVAIESMDLSCLPDGRSVKNFQAHNDFSGLRDHVQFLLSQCKPKAPKKKKKEKPKEPEKAEEPKKHVVPVLTPEEIAEKREQARQAELEAKVRDFLKDRWIMTNRLELKNGKVLTAAILEDHGSSMNLRLPRGKTYIPKKQIENIRPFNRQQLAARMQESLEPLSKDLQHEWQIAVRDEVVEELSRKCIKYGPPFPGAHMISIKEGEDTTDVEANVMTSRGKKTIRTGDKLGGFNVIGIDTETKSVLLQVGEGGEIFRVWPKPKAK